MTSRVGNKGKQSSQREGCDYLKCVRTSCEYDDIKIQSEGLSCGETVTMTMIMLLRSGAGAREG